MSNKKLTQLIFTLAVVLSVIVAGCSQASVQPQVVASGYMNNPKDIVQSFYSAYDAFPDSLAERAYRSDERLTPEFIQRVDEIIDSFDQGGYDPFLCAQDIPGKFVYEDAVLSGTEASVVAHQIWNPGTAYESIHDLTVKLQMVDDDWKIDNVVCPGSAVVNPLTEIQSPKTPGQVVQAFYGWYISYANSVGSPLADKMYRSSRYLAPEFVQRVDEIVASFDRGGYDPFLCAQDIPVKFIIGKVDVLSETASVELNKFWNLGTEYEMITYASVQLREINGRWLIDDVQCLDTGETGTERLPVDDAQIKD